MRRTGILASLVLLMAGCEGTGTKNRDTGVGSEYLRLASESAAWLRSVAVEEKAGTHWLPWKDWEGSGSISLYSGTPGVALFFLEHFKATGDRTSRDLAVRGAAWLAAQAHEADGGLFWSREEKDGKPVPEPGLYTGTAGVATAFLEFQRELKKDEYGKLARRAADWLVAAAEPREKGVAWNNSDDIISGGTGIGLFLVRAAEALDEPRYLDCAVRAGDFLMHRALRDEPGWKWRAGDHRSTIYPNFSHGTSGTAYFLAVLYGATGQERFLQAALRGAEWLEGHRENEGEGTAWYHHEPDGKQLYYVSWCHGPAGTARLFHELHRVTREREWRTRVENCATWLMTCGFLDREWDGFWNVSLCCGSAGIGDFFADLHRATGDAACLEWADRMVEDLKTRSTDGKPGLKWIQAEHRIRPDWVVAQTGYAQGAAGMGLFFLKMHALRTDPPAFDPLRLPDTPFGR